jgi:cytidylate kinase
MRRRDRIDSNREASPLRVAADAVVLDTTDMSVEAVLAETERLVEGGGWTAE